MQVQEKVAAWNQFAQGPVIAPRFAAIERADGELINLDLYQVIVYRLPSHIESITKPSMLQIFHYMIDNINRFTPPGTNFYHYCSDVFGRSGKNPDCPSTNTKRSPQGKLGELVHIELSDDRYFLRKSIIHNDGSVMITQSNYSDSESSLIFTTMYTREDGTHPVSGNRQIGFSQVNPPSLMYRIYFRGADRPNASFKDKILYGGDQVWLSAQKKMTDLINANGGHAEIVKQERFYRPKWEDVREQCHKPDIAWDPQVVFEN
jgi:hypothetical protein